MDYSQIIAAQKLSNEARQLREQTEDEFYERHSASIFETVKGWKLTFFRKPKHLEQVKTDTNCRPTVQKLC